MKPPPRTRTKPNRLLKPDLVPQCSGKVSCKWQRAEKRKLLRALKKLSKTTGGHGDIDYAFLKKHVPTRSISEIHSVIEFLKNKVISGASLNLKKTRWEDKKVRKPIEVWTHMASAVAGTLEEPITSAFSQMLIVSSTEPRTLRNCDPPQVLRPPTDKYRTVGRTIPMRPVPCLSAQGEDSDTNTAPTLLGSAKRLPAPSRVVTVPKGKIPSPQPLTTAGTSPAATCSSQTAATSYQPGTAGITKHPATQKGIPVTGCATPTSNSTAVVKTQSIGSSVIQRAQQPSEHPTTISTLKSTSSSCHMPSSSPATSLTPLTSPNSSSINSSSSATSSCSSTHPTPPISTPAMACCTSKYATEDSPRTFGLKYVVDFEKIYRYLSVIHKPNEECHLTPMESAIMLHLVMSLPEELSLLDCNKLHKHLVQVYQCLSSPANSKKTREMFKNLQSQSGRVSGRTDSQQNGTRTVDSCDVTDSREKTLQSDEAESQSSGSSNTSSQSGNADTMGLYPPLNPFMVPLKLLMHR
ncbi:snRNA-activating protein complex subunit 2 [Toxotes jaculatrix]|uniref:snRNA-activating protein complex subunit 2 n=1 Tax=Toxotes jaculatrix TaxID=941984 RepID=UPI001B3ABD64|nr:snRNA-activating protein complex subunit 2 [Toxotes jaculatrix]